MIKNLIQKCSCIDLPYTATNDTNNTAYIVTAFPPPLITERYGRLTALFNLDTTITKFRLLGARLLFEGQNAVAPKWFIDQPLEIDNAVAIRGRYTGGMVISQLINAEDYFLPVKEYIDLPRDIYTIKIYTKLLDNTNIANILNNTISEFSETANDDKRTAIPFNIPFAQLSNNLAVNRKLKIYYEMETI